MTTRAVFLDVLGTLVELEPPWVHLAAELDVEADERLEAAVRKEMAFYKEHAHEGHDDESLAALRKRCADILSWELDREVPVEAMMDSIRFRTYEDAAGALNELRGMDLKLVCVSNWDVSLRDVLDSCGLRELVDGVVSSASAGAQKPDPAIFAQALEMAGCASDEAVHVGDTPEEDVEGARAAGIRAILIDRDGGGDIASLAELPGVIRGG